MRFTIIKQTTLDELKAKARQHDTLKVYTDDKLRELETQKSKLREENQNYRDALRLIFSNFNYEKQQQNYNSLANFIKKMNSKFSDIAKKYNLD
jgi:ABC-type multidrug transport system ATPase subunit